MFLQKIHSISLSLASNLIKPLWGSGIGLYFPFNYLNKLYRKFSSIQRLPVKTLYNFQMYANANTLIESHVLMYGYWEKNISDLLVQYLNDGDTFLDIGANIGYDTLLASVRVGSSGKVLSFEPSSQNYSVLLENIKLNGFKNIETFKLGVGDVSSEMSIYYCPPNPGATSIVKAGFNNNYEHEDIKIITLDDFIGNQKVDLIKMDIEGFEYEAFLGMKNLLAGLLKVRIIFEFSPFFYQFKTDNVKEYSIHILQTLTEWGFLLYHIEQDGSLTLINNFSEYYNRFDLVKTLQSDILCTKGYTL